MWWNGVGTDVEWTLCHQPQSLSIKGTKTLNHSHKEKNYISQTWITLPNSPPLFSFIVKTVSIFLQVQTTCRWYCTLANYRAHFKDLLIYSCTSPLFPDRHWECRDSPDAMPCCFNSTVMSSILYALFVSYIQHSNFEFLGPEYEKKYQTMNKPMALFSILHCNLIIWYKHVIVSKLCLHQSVWHWNEKCSLCTKLNWRFPLHSIKCVCVSAPRPLVDCSACDWSGFCWAVLSSQAFQEASDQETTMLACTSGTLHPTHAP